MFAFCVAMLEAMVGSAAIAVYISDPSHGEFLLGAGIFFVVFALMIAMVVAANEKD